MIQKELQGIVTHEVLQALLQNADFMQAQFGEQPAMQTSLSLGLWRLQAEHPPYAKVQVVTYTRAQVSRERDQPRYLPPSMAQVIAFPRLKLPSHTSLHMNTQMHLAQSTTAYKQVATPVCYLSLHRLKYL